MIVGEVMRLKESGFIHPLWLVAPASMVVFGLGWSNVGGMPAALLGAVGGLLWSVVLAYLAGRMREKAWEKPLATLACMAAVALNWAMLGGGLLEYLLLAKAIEVSPQWIASLTAGPLAGRVILFFVLFNSAMEILLVPAAVFLNWSMPARRRLVVAAALLFYAIRVWTYLSFAPEYLEFGKMDFSSELVERVRARMAVDSVRIALMVVEASLFAYAAVRNGGRDGK